MFSVGKDLLVCGRRGGEGRQALFLASRMSKFNLVLSNTLYTKLPPIDSSALQKT